MDFVGEGAVLARASAPERDTQEISLQPPGEGECGIWTQIENWVSIQFSRTEKVKIQPVA